MQYATTAPSPGSIAEPVLQSCSGATLINGQVVLLLQQLPGAVILNHIIVSILRL